MKRKFRPTVGDAVRLKTPFHGHSVGRITARHLMESASGLTRLKYVVEVPHRRTKSKTVSGAFEIDQIAPVDVLQLINADIKVLTEDFDIRAGIKLPSEDS